MELLFGDLAFEASEALGVRVWGVPTLRIVWVGVKELKLCYHKKETVISTIYSCYGNLIQVPSHPPNCGWYTLNLGYCPHSLTVG